MHSIPDCPMNPFPRKTSHYGRMASKESTWLWALGVLLALLLGYFVGRRMSNSVENFDDGSCNVCKKAKPCGCRIFQKYGDDMNQCNQCRKPRPCGCPQGQMNNPMNNSDESSLRQIIGSKGVNQVKDLKEIISHTVCPPCEQPDMSKWIMKSSVPPCPPLPDMSRYMLKTECPPQPDMSKYVLKSSVPKCPPCISTCSKPCKIGECPPCPRPRCPVVQCPEPKACPACPAAVCEPCPEPAIQCNAKYEPKTQVRPMLASTSTFGF